MPRRSKEGAVPAFVIPMAAVQVAKLPEGPEWLYELKLDGYRALLMKDGPKAQVRSRNDKNLTRMYPSIVRSTLTLGADQAVLDGEIVALDPSGRPSFQALQHRGSNPGHQIVFYAFDVLHLDGKDLTGEPLTKRRSRLTRVLKPNATLRLSQELPGTATDVMKAVQAAGLEGVVAKRRNSAYQPGERSGDWVKLKLEKVQEFVIGGYRPDGLQGVDALLVGYYEDDVLRFGGKVRAGMVPHVRRQLVKLLQPLRSAACPFANLPDSSTGHWGGGVTADQMREMVWVSAEVVAQIRFAEWTAEGRLRLAKFLGVRRDKAAKDVRRER